MDHFLDDNIQTLNFGQFFGHFFCVETFDDR